MPQVRTCRSDIKAWAAKYLSGRFGLSTKEAKRFKLGETLSLSNVKATKLVDEGFGRITGEEKPETVSVPAEESEEVTDVSN